jgi:hypothetical protein
MEELQNAKYREIMSLRLYYDWHTLVFAPFIVIKIITCCLQGSTHGRSSENDAVPVEGGANHQEAGQVRVFTKVSHACFDPLGSDNMILCRNLGTIKDRKREKRRDKKADNAAEPILKVLRMRFVMTTVVNVVLPGFAGPAHRISLPSNSRSCLKYRRNSRAARSNDKAFPTEMDSRFLLCR